MKIYQVSPKKMIKVSENAGQVNAMLVQKCDDGEQVLLAKRFTSVVSADRWVAKNYNLLLA